MGPTARRATVAALLLLATPRLVPAQTAQGSGTLMPNGAGNAISNMQNSLLADEKSREQVLSLGDDPQVKAILDDPATMRAIDAGDLNALLNDPKLRALLDNPTVRSLVQQQSR